MPGPWEKYQSSEPKSAAPWEKYKQGAPKPAANTALESGALGAAQGATFGFADELEGAARGVYDRISGKSEDIVKAYQEARDKARGRYEKARQDNPMSYMGGEIAGGVGTAFVPGMGWANAAKGAGLATKLGKAAASGAAIGLGQGTADLTKGDVSGVLGDAAIGAGTGAATQGVLSAAGAGLRQLAPKNVAKKLSNVFLNTPEEITDVYINNPKGVLNAPRRIDVAENYQGLLDKLKGEVSEGSQLSRKILRDEGQTVKGSELAKILSDKADELAARSEGVMDDPQTLAAYKWLRDTAEKYAPVKGEGAIIDKKLTTNRVKDMLQSIDRNVDFETAPGKFGRIDDTVKKGIRGNVDELLKGRSPAYAEQMKQVSADTRLLGEAGDIAKSPQGLANVFRRLQTDQYGGGQAPRQVLEQFDKRMGSDILDQAKLSTAREAFDKSVTNGSRNVNMYKGMLENIPYVGKALGAIGGGTIDKYGRKATMGAVDFATWLNKVYQSEGAQSFVQGAQPLVDAARKGNPAAILTFQLLSQSNPQALRHLDQGGSNAIGNSTGDNERGK